MFVQTCENWTVPDCVEPFVGVLLRVSGTWPEMTEGYCKRYLPTRRRNGNVIRYNMGLQQLSLRKVSGIAAELLYRQFWPEEWDVAFLEECLRGAEVGHELLLPHVTGFAKALGLLKADACFEERMGWRAALGGIFLSRQEHG